MKVVHEEYGNRRRKQRHTMNLSQVSALRIIVERTNGCDRAGLIEVRAYS